jgi:hypothetical protein
MSTWRDASRAFDEVEAELSQAKARSDDAEVARLSGELVRIGRDVVKAAPPETAADIADMLCRAIEHLRSSDFDHLIEDVKDGERRNAAIRLFETDLRNVARGEGSA